MNKRKYIGMALFFGIVFTALIQSCDTLKVDLFGEEKALYFEHAVYQGREWKYIDTAVIAVANYPGQTEVRHPFKVCLIGDTLQEDMEYRVIAVDTLTTAREGMVTLPERLVFRKGVVADSLWLTVHSDRVGKDEEYYITFRLVPNVNFSVGYKENEQVKLWFNNRKSQPLWWNKRIVDVYLGGWSSEKFNALVFATEGINSFEGLSASEMRRYSLMLKEYIRKTGATEADGSPMIVPIY